MLRVLTLSTLFPDASRPRFGPFVELQARNLAAHRGVELRVVAPRGIPPMGALHPRYRALAAIAEEERWHGLHVYRPRYRHLPATGGRFDAGQLARALTPLLESIRRTFAFDMIDAQFFFPDGPAAIKLGRAFGVPVSIKARGADIHYWGMQNDATRAQVIAAGQAATGMLAVSEALKADMAALGLPAERIAVHRTGIDRTLFRVRDRAAAKAALGVSGPLLVSVGNLIERKGHAIVVDALAQLPDARLVIIGQGDQQAAIEARITRLALGDRVRLIGSKPHDVVADWLAAADAMVLMSASEGLANGWVEALASGTPLVIADVGGAREIVDTPEAGVLAAREPLAVAGAIRALLARDVDRDAVARTVADYSWEANAAMLFDHLTTVAARR